MSDEIFNIFEAAIELEPDARKTFLDQKCGGDAELRRQIEELLACDERAEGFIESPTIEAAFETIAEDELSSQMLEAVGPFTIQGSDATSR